MNLKRQPEARRRKFMKTSAKISLKIGPRFWQLQMTMTGNKAQAQIPDFRREDGIWV